MRACRVVNPGAPRARLTVVRSWLPVLLLLATGCTSTPGEGRAPAPPAAEQPVSAEPADDEPIRFDLPALERSYPPRLGVVRGHVLHRADGTRLRIRLGLRGPWGITSMAPDGDGFLVTDDRWFEGSVGMHRVDARGRSVASWASTGPAAASRGGAVAWVSIVVPESGESGPTEIHTSNGVQRLEALIMPSISGYDGRVVRFTALRREGRRYVRRAFATDLVDPPRRVPRPPT